MIIKVGSRQHGAGTVAKGFNTLIRRWQAERHSLSVLPPPLSPLAPEITWLHTCPRNDLSVPQFPHLSAEVNTPSGTLPSAKATPPNPFQTVPLTGT